MTPATSSTFASKSRRVVAGQSEIVLQIYGCFSAANSIANICRQFAYAMTHRFQHVALKDSSLFDKSWHAFKHLPGARLPSEGSGVRDPELQRYEGHYPDAPIGFFYGTPDEAWPNLKRHAVKIGGFVCETDRIPSTWVDVCNRLDLIYVPSTFCETAFRSSGVTSRIRVVPHGLEAEFCPTQSPPGTQPLTFFNTFSAYSFPERKGCEELIRCFLRAFKGRSDVKLRLRTHDFGLVEKCRKTYDFGNLIEVIPFHYGSLADVARHLRSAHCVVHPSKGEGFGLIPFQAIACGTPVIAPISTGMSDYLSERNSMPLKTTNQTHGPSWGNQPGRYVNIDEDHLVHLLQYAASNWEHEYRKIRSICVDFANQYRWNEVMKPVISDLTRLYASVRTA